MAKRSNRFGSSNGKSAEAVADLAAYNGGILTTAEAVGEGFANCRLTEAVDRGYLERVERGVYCIPEIWEDQYYIYFLRYPKGIFSDESALVIHGLLDFAPMGKIVMNFPRGYNASSARRSGVEVRTCPSEHFLLGVGEFETSHGNIVSCYDAERSLCDVLRYRSMVDVEPVMEAFRRYAVSDGRDFKKLFECAKKLKASRKVLYYVFSQPEVVSAVRKEIVDAYIEAFNVPINELKKEQETTFNVRA